MDLKTFLVAQGDLRQRLYNIDQQRKKDAYTDVLRQIQLNQATRQEEIAKISHIYNKAIAEYKSSNTDFLIEAEKNRAELDNLKNENLISLERLKQETFPLMRKQEIATAKLDNAFLMDNYVDKIFKNRATAIKAEFISKYVDANGNIDIGGAKREIADRAAELDRLAQIDTEDAKIEWIRKKAEYMAANIASAELSELAAKTMQTKGVAGGVNTFETPAKIDDFNKFLKSQMAILEKDQKESLGEGQTMPDTVSRILSIGSKMNDKTSDQYKYIKDRYPLVVDYVDQKYDGDFTAYMTAVFGGDKPIYKFGSKDSDDFKYLEITGKDIINNLKSIDNEIKSMYSRIGKTGETNPYDILRKIGNKLDNKNSTEYRQLKSKFPAAISFIESYYGTDNPFSVYINDIINSLPYFETVESLPDDFEANLFRDAAIKQLSSFEHSLTQHVQEQDIANWYNNLSEEERVEVTDTFGEQVKDTLLNKISRQYEDEGIVASGVFDMMWQRLKQKSSDFVDYISTMHLDDSIVDDEIIKINDAAIKFRMRSLPQEVINDLGDNASNEQIADEIGKRLFIEFGEQVIKQSSYGSLVYSYPEPNPDWPVESEQYYQYLLNKNVAGAATPEERQTLKRLSFKRNVLGTLPGQRKPYRSRDIVWKSVRQISQNSNKSFIEMNNKMKAIMGGEFYE